jgi:hypothetical protein
MRVVDLRPLLLSVALDRPVRTAFGAMTRHAILVEVATDEGRTVLGESWRNFPAWAHVGRGRWRSTGPLRLAIRDSEEEHVLATGRAPAPATW